MLKRLTSSLEDYLEIIYLLEREHGHAHVRDIACKLQIKPPSVSEILRKMKRARLVSYESYGSITLTRKGSSLATKVLKRHRVLNQFLHDVVGVEKQIAEQDACKIEHVISSETLSKLYQHIKKRG